MAGTGQVRARNGDTGDTAIGNGTRVRKTHLLIEALGDLDELNCVLGVLAQKLKSQRRFLVRSIQNDLFDLGADLCVPLAGKRGSRKPRRLTAEYCARLERGMERLKASAGPGWDFVLPGGSEAVAWAHLARAVCRRAERRTWTLAEQTEINRHIPKYLNRLSDLLFTLSRALNAKRPAPRWRPGASLRET